MGLRFVVMVCQRFIFVVIWILVERGILVFNYFNDFIGILSFFDVNFYFEEFGVLLKFLGLEEFIDKCCFFFSIMICLGVELNTIVLILLVSSDRLFEFDNLLYVWLYKRIIIKKVFQFLVGKLIFVFKCVRQGRIFIVRILRLLRFVQFNYYYINLNAEFRKDIYWWCRFLREYNGVLMINIVNWSSLGEVFFIDVCFRGCGGIFVR